MAASVKEQEAAVRRSALAAAKRGATLSLHRTAKDSPVLDSLLSWPKGQFATRTPVVVDASTQDPTMVCKLLLQNVGAAEPSDELVHAATKAASFTDGFSGGAFQMHSAVARFLPCWAALMLVEEGPEGRIGPIFLEGPALPRRELTVDSARRALLLSWVCAFVVYGHETSRVSIYPPEPLVCQLPKTKRVQTALSDSHSVACLEETVSAIRKRVRALETSAPLGAAAMEPSVAES